MNLNCYVNKGVLLYSVAFVLLTLLTDFIPGGSVSASASFIGALHSRISSQRRPIVKIGGDIHVPSSSIESSESRSNYFSLPPPPSYSSHKSHKSSKHSKKQRQRQHLHSSSHSSSSHHHNQPYSSESVQYPSYSSFSPFSPSFSSSFASNIPKAKKPVAVMIEMEDDSVIPIPIIHMKKPIAMPDQMELPYAFPPKLKSLANSPKPKKTFMQSLMSTFRLKKSTHDSKSQQKQQQKQQHSFIQQQIHPQPIIPFGGIPMIMAKPETKPAIPVTFFPVMDGQQPDMPKPLIARPYENQQNIYASPSEVRPIASPLSETVSKNTGDSRSVKFYFYKMQNSIRNSFPRLRIRT